MSQVFSPRARSSACQRPVSEPGPLHGALAAGMRDLDARHHVLRLHEGRDALQRRDVRRRPQPHVAVGDAALRGHCRGLDEDAGRAAQRQPAQVREVEVLRDAVDRRVGRHGCDDDAVLERDALDGDGREEQRLGHGRVRASVACGGGSGAQQYRAAAVKYWVSNGAPQRWQGVSHSFGEATMLVRSGLAAHSDRDECDKNRQRLSDACNQAIAAAAVRGARPGGPACLLQRRGGHALLEHARQQ